MSDREKKIAEIREALEKATPGPWAMIEPIDEVWQSIDNTKIATVASNQDADANLHLIANAPEWLRFLLELFDEAKKDAEFWKNEYEKGVKRVAFLGDSFERLRQERDKLIEGLRWYGDEIKYMNWPSELWINQGQRARDILLEIGVTVE